MDSHKGAITLILAVLVLFGIFIVFTGVFDGVLETIGSKFSTLVNDVFDRVGENDPTS